jgi:uncharacterized membrane protein
MKEQVAPVSPQAMNIPNHVSERIEAVAGLHGRAERDVPAHQRRVEQLTSALGRPRFLYTTLALAAGWIGVNVAAPLFGVSAFDPAPFHHLHLLLTLGALSMATVVLSTQERQMRAAERLSRLELQINLLSERRIAKAISLLEELRRDLPDVRNRADSEARSLTLPTDPQVVSAALEESIEAELHPPDARALPEVSKR